LDTSSLAAASLAAKSAITFHFSGNVPKEQSQFVLLRALDLSKKCFPEISILDICLSTGSPSICEPSFAPFGRPIDRIRRIGRNDKGIKTFALPEPEAESSNDGTKLCAVAALNAIVGKGALLL
jgi:hypothetical protein